MTDLVPVTLNDRMAYSKALAASDLLPKQYRDKPANVLVAVEYGSALGLSPMAAIQGIHVVEGKPTASAQLIGALVRNAGHRLRVTGNDEHAVAIIVRADDPDFEFRAEWTLARAQKAGLAGKGVWKQYPAAMLKARAITEVARDACPEVLSGVAYTAEELDSHHPSTVPTVDTARLIPTSQAEVVDTETGEILDAEVVEDEPAPEAPASTNQLRTIGRLFNELGYDRDTRLLYVNQLLAERDMLHGKPVETADAMTYDQAGAVIAHLEEAESA